MKASVSLTTSSALFFALFSNVSQAADTSLVHLDKRIIAGTVVANGKYPFAVRLNIQRGLDEYLCGGALLLNNYVVTAAHCLVDSDTNAIAEPHTVSVCYGSNSVLEQTCTPALNVTVHRRYNPETISNDIAMLKISPVVLKTGSVETVPVYTGQLAEKQTLTTMGWGKTSNNSTDLPTTLMSVDIMIGTTKECRVANSDYSSPNGPEVCSANALTPGKDSCQGDSGSPTIISSNGAVYLAAVTSSGTDPSNPGSADCATSDGLAFYTHVNYFMSFISLTTGQLPSAFTGNQKSSTEDSISDSSSTFSGENNGGSSTIAGTASALLLSSLAMAIILSI
ncbi:hypothetical protein IWW37_004897 [Coemansia sp. RSA 2050]|nr:hypothetical protein IWW37_004897 [Coemansia sp. RSA 2050]KAJ2730955.1 hypothetical protein IW152_004877 [Coemansia sp. BCRC 34962]